ncbi:hypothetical protein HHL16_10320 [Pseudoflavitalea sp. G-6-1-2]|uniref:hypothetical protein n=1 Tax=Pseudoflavitalea sp. G-6-1-2 TaxID=2728841 RepID=UPI00146D25C9|nr:hypothetical protein [Pseudoflavitalea sp. G-6-1-2]NML21269.1 hypothetical protein [Pseudoflavitalea sp. G-6-1-2]
MFERDFLAYVLYTTLLEFRENAYAEGNSRLFHLADILHNAPLSLHSEHSAKMEYERLLENVEVLGVKEWLEKRMQEFTERYTKSEE